MSTSGGTSGGASPVSVATAHLSAAALQVMHSAPTQIVAAPGVGLAIGVLGVFAQLAAGVDGYYPAAGYAGLFYGAGVTGREASARFGQILALVPSASRFAMGGNVPSIEGSGLLTANANNAALVVAEDVGDSVVFGPIVTATLAAGGTGYAVGDTGTIGPHPDTGDTSATYHVTTVAAITGAVTAFTVTAAGSGYTTTDNPEPTAVGGAQPGGGTGLTVNVTAIPSADGDLYVTVTYQILVIH